MLVGGENVYCSEVEAALHAHPRVAAASAFGAPSALLGEVVAVAVVLRDEAVPGGVCRRVSAAFVLIRSHRRHAIFGRRIRIGPHRVCAAERLFKCTEQMGSLLQQAQMHQGLAPLRCCTAWPWTRPSASWSSGAGAGWRTTRCRQR